MRVPIYQVDAFTSEVFHGNPAAVCPLEDWLPDEVLQAIAAENNLSETAFFIPQSDAWSLRWFTPLTEVDLCGHATLAAAFVLFQRYPERAALNFHSRSGVLTVTRANDLLILDFPAWPPAPHAPLPALTEGLGRAPVELLKARDYLAVFASEDDVRALQPDMETLKRLVIRGVIATAPGRNCDFVSRFFAPTVGIPEDPVTGSAHCTLAPYWAERLGKRQLHARQISARGGELFCETHGERVSIAGRAVLYLEGSIRV